MWKLPPVEAMTLLYAKPEAPPAWRGGVDLFREAQKTQGTVERGGPERGGGSPSPSGKDKGGRRLPLAAKTTESQTCAPPLPPLPQVEAREERPFFRGNSWAPSPLLLGRRDSSSDEEANAQQPPPLVRSKQQATAAKAPPQHAPAFSAAGGEDSSDEELDDLRSALA